MRPIALLALLALLLVAASSAAVASATDELRLAGVFGSNMVLQHGTPVILWGWAPPAAAVEAELRGGSSTQRAAAIAAANGTFSVEFAPQPPSATPHTITITVGTESLVLTNVVLGEVLLCAGQSNMVYGLNYVDRYNPGHSAVSGTEEPLLRLFTTAQRPSRAPSLNASSATNYTWAVSSPTAVNYSDSGFSAACWFAGKELLVGADSGAAALGLATAGTPVGLMVSAWDGTVIEAWSPPTALRKCDGPGRRQQALDHDHGPPGTAPGPEEPSVLYNGLIWPLLHLGLRAVLWYQGEQNSVAPLQYTCQFPAMITAWRDEIKALRPGATDVPFVFIQIAPVPELSAPLFGQPPGASQWTEIRFAQSAALLLNGTAMVPNNDLGDPSSFLCLHPRWKAEVGRRSALQLAVVAFDRRGVEAAPRSYGGPRLARDTSPTFSVEMEADGTTLLAAQLQFEPNSAGTQGIGLWSTKFCTKCCPNSTNTAGLLPFRAQMKPVYPDSGGPIWARANATRINGSMVSVEWRMPVGVTLSTANLSGAWLTYAWEDYPDCVLGDLDQKVPAPQLMVTPVEK